MTIVDWDCLSTAVRREALKFAFEFDIYSVAVRRDEISSVIERLLMLQNFNYATINGENGREVRESRNYNQGSAVVISDFLRREAQFPWKSILVTAGMLGCVVLFQLAKGGHRAPRYDDCLTGIRIFCP